MFNAMTFKDVKSFMLVLLKELETRLQGTEKKLSQIKYTDDELAAKIAKTLQKLSDKETKDQKESEESDESTGIKPHTIIVIDEVDQFSSFEKSFTLLVRGILAQETKANTSIIGIANSVDLPFKKKHSAIAMRDC